MASQSERRPEWSGASGMPLKPTGDPIELGSVPTHWLNEDEHRLEAESVDRITADYQWVQDLALAGFEGARWDFFANELAKYGMAVMGGWMFRGVIWQRCQQRGLGGLQPVGRPFTKDEVDDLTGETVAKALYHFRRDVLMKKKWDPARGASLRTYFVGQCLIRFANIYRRWLGQETRAGHSITAENPWKKVTTPLVDGPEGAALDRVLVRNAMDEVHDSRVRAAMILTSEGKTQAEIAIELEVSKKTVERALANERQRLRKWRDA